MPVANCNSNLYIYTHIRIYQPTNHTENSCLRAYLCLRNAAVRALHAFIGIKACPTIIREHAITGQIAAGALK